MKLHPEDLFHPLVRCNAQHFTVWAYTTSDAEGRGWQAGIMHLTGDGRPMPVMHHPPAMVDTGTAIDLASWALADGEIRLIAVFPMHMH